MDKLFRTTFTINSVLNISYKDNILLTGSCFAENIGNKFVQLQFKTRLNPYGILYNPYSIETMFRELYEGKTYSNNDLDFNNNKWFSFNHHGAFSDNNIDLCLKKINNSIIDTKVFLNSVDYVIITLGTAMVYFNINNDLPVGNCHKIPAKQFYSRRLNLEETIDSLNRSIKYIRECNASSKIIFTVSPIRHLKDGAVENQLSKATLLLAVDEIKATLPNIYYFPAYEIVMDDLRDYRFFSEDMLHPNNSAINYIWNIFKDNYIDEICFDLMSEIEKLNVAQSHMVDNQEGYEYFRFEEYILQQKRKIENMKEELIMLDKL